MLYRVLADLTVTVHLAFIVFVVLGGLLALKWRNAPLVHLPAALWGVLLEYSGWICPLTPLENRLRIAAGEAGYRGGFVENYLLPVVYPEWLAVDLQYLVGTAVVLVNVAVYWWVISHRRRSM